MTKQFRDIISREASSVKMLETKKHSAGDLVFPCSHVLPTAPAQQPRLGKEQKEESKRAG